MWFATSLDEAMEKVESFDGDYYVNKNTITNTELIEFLTNNARVRTCVPFTARIL